MISITKLSNNFEIVDLINGTQLTKESLSRFASGYQQLFLNNNLVKGDRVGLAMQEDFHHLACVFAAIDYGLIIVISGEHEITNEYTSRRNIKAMITRGIQPCTIHADNCTHLDLDDISVTEDMFEGVETYIIDHSEVLIEALTSGSTGVPKCIQHTHKSVESATDDSIRLYWKEANTSWFFHNIVHLGVSSVYFFPALFSSKRIVLPRLDNPYNAEDLDKYKPDMMLIFPVHFQLYAKQGIHLRNFDYVKWVLTGGSVIDNSFIRRLVKNQGVEKVAVIYGLTECLPPLIHKVVDKHNLDLYNSKEMGSIVDNTGSYDINENEILTIEGSSHMCKSINDESVDVFVTQDIVSADTDTFYFEKRNSDLIRIDDQLINPQQLVPNWLEGYCCVFSISQTHVVVVMQHKDVNVKQLVQKLADNGISVDKLVTHIELNVLGKPNINKLKGIYEKGN